jgi:hypothetical protein
VLELVDATALLWRLHLRGVDVSGRWSAVAWSWDAVGDAGTYAFNDWHAMMAFVCSGRVEAQAVVVEKLRVAARGEADAAAFAREIGLEAALAMQAFGAGRYAETVRWLRLIRHYAHRFGGSHAQRDLMDLTLMEAAMRAGNPSLASALAAERAARRPQSPLADLCLKRAIKLHPGGGTDIHEPQHESGITL